MAKLNVLQLAQQLIEQPSVTPNDGNCQALMMEALTAIGFSITPLPFGEVQNFWAQRGSARPLLVFAGHTDVVPAGDESKWQFPPFQGTLNAGYLYGRGAADMKGSLAAMLVACTQFIEQNPDHPGSIGFLITSDEEGPALNGTAKVVEYLKLRKVGIDYCVVGEPSSSMQLGDTIKIGRRGSLNGKLSIQGIQGHIAYPELADNPIHSGVDFLNDLIAVEWDSGNEFFPATSLQISNIHAGTGATNVIPATMDIHCNWRFSTATSADEIKLKVNGLLAKHNLNYTIEWQPTNQPFYTSNKTHLIDITQRVIKEICGITPQLSTNGGTSDGRFIATLGCEVIELGPCNRSIHQIDERVAITELEQLTEIYQLILQRLLLG